MFAVTSTVSPNVILAPLLFTLVFPNNVTPPVPKSITSAELVIVAPTREGALPPNAKPPLKANVSVPAAPPKVTRPVLRKLTLVSNVFAAPDMVIA